MEAPTGTISDSNTMPITSDAGTNNMTSTTSSNTTSAGIPVTDSSPSSSSASASSSSSSPSSSSSSSPPTSSNNPSSSGDSKLPTPTIALEQQDKNSIPESVTTNTSTQSKQNSNAPPTATTTTTTTITPTTPTTGAIAEPSQSTITKIQKVKHNSSSRLNPILIAANDRKSRKRKPKVSWPNEEKLRSFHYFEYIPDERVNVMHRLQEQQNNADTPTPPTPNASANTATSSSLNKVPNNKAGSMIGNSGAGVNRIDSEKYHEYFRWRPLIPIDFTPKLQSPGWNSIERTAQAERETYVLGAIDLPGQPSIIDEPDQPEKAGNSTNLNESLTQSIATAGAGGATGTVATATLKDGTVYPIIEIPANNVEGGTFKVHSNMYEDDNNRLFDNQLQQPMLQPFLQQPQMQMTQMQQPQMQLTGQMQQPLLQHQQMQLTQMQQPQFQITPQMLQPQLQQPQLQLQQPQLQFQQQQQQQLQQPQLQQSQLQQPQLQQSQMQQPMIFFYHPQLHCFRY